MSDEHRCFATLRDNYDDPAPFERPVYIDKETLDFKTAGWHIAAPNSKRLYEINFCPFCGERLNQDA